MREKLQNIFETVRISLKIKVPRKDCNPRISSKAYKLGDLVYYQVAQRTVGKSPKLKSDIWKDPCVETRKLSGIVFKTKTNFQCKPRILHFDRLKSHTSDSVPEPVQKLRKHITRSCVKESSKTDPEPPQNSKQRDLKENNSKKWIKSSCKTNSKLCYKTPKRSQREEK